MQLPSLPISQARRVQRRLAAGLRSRRPSLASPAAAAAPTTAGAGPATALTPAFGAPLGPPLAKVAPRPDQEWQEPPRVADTGKSVRSLYDPGQRPPRFDIELVDELNREYESRRLVPSPPSYTPEALQANARRRTDWVHSMVDLVGKRTLEIGCGNGYEVWSLAHNYGADAHGVDVTEYGPWDELSGEHVHLVCADLTTSQPFPEQSFDRILSFTVWEHVLHPYALLEQTYRLLRPGGLAWIRANLYAGPQASHRYRDLYFPWPHLLFSDDVLRDWDVSHGREPRGPAWVNRWSWAHYESAFVRLGFRIRHLSFTKATWDEDFYRRFEDTLGRYPRFDLERDYFLVVLERPE